MFIHLANSSLKPLCGKMVETEPIDHMEYGAELCPVCEQRVTAFDDYILLAELARV